MKKCLITCTFILIILMEIKHCQAFFEILSKVGKHSKKVYRRGGNGSAFQSVSISFGGDGAQTIKFGGGRGGARNADFDHDDFAFDDDDDDEMDLFGDFFGEPKPNPNRYKKLGGKVKKKFKKFKKKVRNKVNNAQNKKKEDDVIVDAEGEMENSSGNRNPEQVSKAFDAFND